jgi:hypothetical protein
MMQKTQAAIQKLYKKFIEAPIIVEDTMEERVLKNKEFIKGFFTRI